MKRLTLVLALLAAGCHAPEARMSAPLGEAGTLAAHVEEAHGADVWRAHRAIAGNLYVSWGGKTLLEGEMTYDWRRNRCRLDLNDGTTLVFDGKKAWVTPASAEITMARFHLLTWPYFLLAPFRLRDPGSHLVPGGTRMLHDEPHAIATLTFDAGVRDSPDDWYIAYEDPATGRLAAMAYIVTYGGTPREEAEKDPHIIVYDGFEEIAVPESKAEESIVLSTAWTFYQWDEEEGWRGGPIGEATLSNLHFVEPDRSIFIAPAGAREDKVPSPGG